MAKDKALGQSLKKFLTDGLFPEKFTCLACDIEIFEGELCPDCLKRQFVNDGPTCPKCGRKTAKSEICIECKAHLPAYDRAVSPLVYEDGSAELVAAFKSGRPYIAKYLSARMTVVLKELPEAEGIVYVPMTERALRERGYNQSELLAKRISEKIGVPVLVEAVTKVKETPPQKELSRAQRLKNPEDCFKADKKQIKGKTLLVVDDIMTTGATADGMALCLKRAGAGAVFVVTAASVKYNRGDLE